MKKKIKRNIIRCKICDTVIESKHRHHFVVCNCWDNTGKGCFVDGGTAYIRTGGDLTNIEYLTEYENEEETRL